MAKKLLPYFVMRIWI